MCFVIGQSEYFGFGFATELQNARKNSDKKHSKKSFSGAEDTNN